jgi:hypothetical protein
MRVQPIIEVQLLDEQMARVEGKEETKENSQGDKTMLAMFSGL